MHFSFSASLTSCDGEYRPRLLRWQDMIGIKRDYIGIWDDISEYLSIEKENRGWSLYTNHFSSNSDKFQKLNNDLDQIIKTEMYPMMFLDMTWFITIYNELIGLSESHMNENFREIFLGYYKTDVEFIKQMIKTK